MTKKIKDLGLEKKPKQPTTREAQKPTYPHYVGSVGEAVKKVAVETEQKFEKAWSESPFARQRFENRVKRISKNKK